MADTILSYTIPEAKVDEYVSDYVYIHKNSEVDGEGDPIYTDTQWVREHINRFIRNQVIRGKTAKYRDLISNYNADDIT